MVASYLFFFFFNDTATTEICTLSLHDALPISTAPRARDRSGTRGRRGGPAPRRVCQRVPRSRPEKCDADWRRSAPSARARAATSWQRNDCWPVSSCCIAGINREHGPRDAFCFVAEKELDGVRHVVDVGKATKRTAPRDLLPLLAFEPLSHFGVQEAGRDRVHVHAHAPDLPCKRSREADQRRLGRAVD